MTTSYQVRIDLPGEIRRLHLEPEQMRLHIAEALGSHGISLNMRCGGQGVCDGCEVELIDGAVMDFDTCRPLNARTAPVRFRACQSQFIPSEEATIRVPVRSLATHHSLATAEFCIRVPFANDPLFDGQFAAVIDVGTTSVTVAIVDLHDGEILAAKSASNAQARWGQDVLSRISYCQRDCNAVAALQEAINRKTIRPLIEQCLDQCGTRCHELAGATIAGNTVMLHLLAGEDPTSLGRAPFAPVFLDHRMLSAKAIGLAGRGLPDVQPIHLLPSASAYVGADIVGGAIATGFAYKKESSILLDLGTNGEIIARNSRRVLGCATAAGPAFEGTGLTCGMIAGPGAISRVRLEVASRAVELEVIGDERARGICGSAYIDLLAEGRRTGLIDHHGRLRFDDTAEFRSLRQCIDGEAALRIASDAQQRPIVLTEGDIAALLQAKAAIAAGALTLMERCDIDASDVREAFVAGAFGSHLNVDHAINIGLLPARLRGRVKAVGNAALAGAYMAALDRRVLDDLERCARDLETVELNLDERFESRFIDQLLLP